MPGGDVNINLGDIHVNVDGQLRSELDRTADQLDQMTRHFENARQQAEYMGQEYGNVKEQLSGLQTTMANFRELSTDRTFFDLLSDIGRTAEANRTAFENFNKAANVDTSTELIKTVNALKVMSDGNLKNVVSDVKALNEAYSQAAKIAPQAERLYSWNQFDQMHTALDTLKKAGIDTQDLFSKIFSGENVHLYQKQIEELQKELTIVKGQAEELKGVVGKDVDASSIDTFLTRIKDLEKALNKVNKNAAEEFKTFLQGNALDPNNGAYADYIKKLEAGAITAYQAISKFRSEHEKLFQGNGGGGFNTEQVAAFSKRLDEINVKLDQVVAKLNGTGSGEGLDKLNGQMEKGVQFSTAEAQSIKALSEVIEKLDNSSGAASERMKSLTTLMKSIGDIGENSLRNLSSAMMNLVNMGGDKFNAKPIENLAAALGAFKGVQNAEYLAALSNLHFDGLKELTVSKAALQNLAEYLPKIAGSDMDNLAKLAGFDFSKLSGLRVTKAQLEGVSGLKLNTEKLQELSQIDFTNLQNLKVSKASIDALNSIRINKASIDAIANLSTAATSLAPLNEALKAIGPTLQQLGNLSVGDALTRIPPNITAIGDAAEQASRGVQMFREALEGAAKANLPQVGSTTPLVESMQAAAQAAQVAEGAVIRVKSAMTDAAQIQLRDGLNQAGLSDAEMERVAASLRDVNATITQVRTNYAGVGDEQKLVTLTIDAQNEQLNQSLRYLYTYDMETGEIAGRLTSVTTRMAEVTKATKESAQATTEQKEAAAQANVALREQSDATKEIKRQYEDIVKLLDPSAFAFDETRGSGTAAVEQNRRIEELKQAYRDLAAAQEVVRKQGGAATPEEIQRVNDLQQRLKELIEANRQYLGLKSTVETAANQRAEETAAKEAARTNALRQATAQYDQMAEAMRRWEAAGRGTTNTNYTAIQEAARSLQEYITKAERGEDVTKQLTNATAQAKLAMQQHGDAIKVAGAATETLGTKLATIGKRFTAMFSMTRIVSMIYREMREMAKASIEIDDAMTQMRIVTDASDAAMTRFGDNMAETAKRIGSSITDLVDSATVFARIGYTLEDSSTLAEYTTMLQNVGDIDVQSAQDALTSIVKAFDVNVEDIEKVMDELVIVGNNFPISVSQIAEGMTNASSTLAASGNSFEKSVALLTAANTTLQNASKASTGLRTIAARIRNTKAELDELGETMTTAKYEEAVKILTGYNVALTDINGEYRATYDIMADIAAQWDKMTSMEQAALATTLAGTRQQDVFYSLVGQFQEASKAMDRMEKSAGTLQDSYQKFLASTTGHINQFKAALQQLGSNLFESDVLSGIVDMGTGILNLINSVDRLVDMFGGLRTVLVGLGLTLINIKAIKIGDLLKNTAAQIANIPSVLGKVVTAIQLSIGSGNSLSASLKSVGISATTAQLALGALSVVVAGVAVAVARQRQRVEELRRSQIEAFEAASQQSGKILDLVDDYGELNKALEDGTLTYEAAEKKRDDIISQMGIEKSRVEELTKEYGNYTDAVRAAALEKLQEQRIDLTGGFPAYQSGLRDAWGRNARWGTRAIDFSQGSAATEALDILAAAGYDQVRYDVETSVLDMSGILAETDEQILQVYDDLAAALSLLESEGIDGSNPVYAMIYEQYNSMKGAVKDYKEALDALNTNLVQEALLTASLGKELPTTQEGFDQMRQSVIDAVTATGQFKGSEEDISALVDSVLQAQTAFAGFYKEAEGGGSKPNTNSVAQDLSASLDNMKAAYDAMAKAQKEMDDGAGLSAETIKALKAASEDYLDYLYEENGVIKLNTEAWKEYADAEMNTNRLAILDDINEAQKAYDEAVANRDAAQHEKDQLFANWFGGIINYEEYEEAKGTAQEAYDKAAAQAEKAEQALEAANEKLRLYQAGMEAVAAATDGAAASSASFLDTVTATQSAYDALASAEKDMADGGGLTIATIKALAGVTDDYLQYLYATEDGIKLNAEAWREFATQDISAEIDRLNAAMASKKRQLGGMMAYGRGDTSEAGALAAGIEEDQRALDLYEQVLEMMNASTEEAVAGIARLTESLGGMKDAYDILKTANEEMAAGGGLSLETIEKLAAATDDYIDYLYVENGMVKLNTEAWEAYAKAKAAEDIAEIQARLDALRAEGESLTEGTAEYEENAAAIEKAERELELYQTALDNTVASLGKTEAAVKSLTDALSDYKKGTDLIAQATEEMKTGGLSYDTIASVIENSDDFTKYLYLEGDAVKMNTAAYREYVEAQKASSTGIEATKKRIEELQEVVRKNQKYMDDAKKALGLGENDPGLNSWKKAIADAQSEIAALEGPLSLLEAMFAAAGAGAEEAAKNLTDLSAAMKGIKDAYDALNAAQKDMRYGGLSEETIEKLASLTDDFTKYLYVENGVIKLNTEAWEEFAATDTNAHMASIQAEIDELYERKAAIEANIEAEKALVRAGMAETENPVRTAQSWTEGANEMADAVERLGNDEALDAMERYVNLNFPTQNVDLFNRKILTGRDMLKAGYEEFKGFEDELVTLYSHTITAGHDSDMTDLDWKRNVIIDLTPIDADGNVLSEDELYDYVADILSISNSYNEIIANDDRGLIMRIKPVVTVSDEDIDEAFERSINESEIQMSIAHALSAAITAGQGAEELGGSVAGFIRQCVSGGMEDAANEEYYRSDALAVTDALMGLFQEDVPESAYDSSEAISGMREELDGVNESIAQQENELLVWDTIFGGVMGNVTSTLDEYKAALEDFADVADTINSVSDSMQTLADIQDEVANGFTLSLDKALEFASVYPEILNSATVTADGQIALDENVVNAFISGKEAELQAQVDADIQQLESQRQVLQAKMQLAQAQLQIAQAAAGGGDIEWDMAQNAIDATNAALQAKIQAGNSEVDAYNEVAGLISQNLDSMNLVAAGAAEDIDRNLNTAAASAATGMQTNSAAMVTSFNAIIDGAHQASIAVAGIGTGTVQGSRVSASGRGGTNLSGNYTANTGKYSGVGGTAVYKPVDLNKTISNLTSSIQEYTNAIAQIDGQIASLQALRGKSLSSYRAGGGGSGGGGGGGRGGGGGGGGSSSKDDASNWFEEQYALHQHLMAMDAEEVGDYLAWLNDAYKRAYQEGLFELEDFYKYQEEVYKGLHDLFKDYLADVEHEISMRENYIGENGKIVSLYQELIAAVEKEISSARAQGLDDTDDYIQELQKKWFSYKDAITKIQDELEKNAKSATDKLVDYRLKMLKQEISDQKDAIKERLSDLKDFYDKQKDLLKDARDEEKYLDEQAEKRKAVADIQAEMAQLEYDNSAWAQKRKLQLRTELSDAQKELDDFEKDHALEVAQDELDRLYELQKEELDAQTDLLDQRQNDAKALYEQALEDIKNGSIELYEEMVSWNDRYGDGIQDTIKSAWEEAYKALSDYKALYGSLYNGFDVANATGYTAETERWDTATISGTNPANKVERPPAPVTTPEPEPEPEPVRNYPYGRASEVTAALRNGSTGKAVRALQYALNELGYGNSGTNGLDGIFGSGTGRALANFQKAVGLQATSVLNDETKRKLREAGYARGTRSATSGLHAIDEKGSETIFESKDGSRYKLFTGGEKVLDARASEFLYDFAKSGGGLIEKIVKDAISGAALGVGARLMNYEIHTGDIIINGNADKETVSEIRRAQRDSVEMMLKEFGRLKR